MDNNPIQQRLQQLGIIPAALSRKSGVSEGSLSELFVGKHSLGPKSAERIAPVVGVSALTLLVSNSAWRRLEGIKLTGNERALLDLVSEVSGLEAASLAHLAHLPAAGLTLNEAVKVLSEAKRNEIPDAPAVVLAGDDKYEKTLKTNENGAPIPSAVVLRDQSMEHARKRFQEKIFGGDK